MAFQVVDADQGDSLGQGNAFGRIDPDQEAPGQARPVSDGDGVYFIPANPGGNQSILDNGPNGQDVLAGGDFGKNPAITPVNIDLGGDDIGADVEAVLDHGGGIHLAGGQVVVNGASTITGNAPDNCYPTGSVSGCVG